MRFRPFESISQPPPLRYEDYLAGSDFSNVIPDDLHKATAECFQASKSYLDHLNAEVDSIAEEYRAISKDELKQLAKVTVGNSVYLLKLQQKLKGPPADKSVQANIEIDADSHKHFCTIKVS